MQPFTHLHVASSYTPQHGTRSPEELVAAATAHGAPAAALTDRDGLYGAIRHIQACIDAGIHPIVGVDIQLVDRQHPAGRQDITVLAHGRTDGAGWASLCRVISAAHSPRGNRRRTPRGRPAVDRDRLPGFLRVNGEPTATVLLGADSDVGQVIKTGDHQRAQRLLEAWKQLLHGGVAIEVVWHLTRPGSPRSLATAARLLELADHAQIPAVLTNEVRYAVPDDAIAGDVLDAANQLVPLWEMNNAQPNAQAWLKPTLKMRAIAREIVDASHLPAGAAEELLNATAELAHRCWLDPDEDLRWRRPKVPEKEAIGLAPDEDPERVLWSKCLAGIPRQYSTASPAQLERVHDRLRNEMAVIRQLGFQTYFLTVADAVDRIHRMGVRAQARGSGASSIVNHLLRISIVDPLELDLVAERFLSLRRTSLPDIDIDVESARQHDVYRMLVDSYGADRVSLLAMQTRYQARSAIRAAGGALGLDEKTVDWVAKSIWRLDADQIAAALSKNPELREVAAAARTNAGIRRLLDLAARLARLPHTLSTHPCGVLLGPADLMSLTPVQPSGMGLLMSQFDKDDIDQVGLLKLDVLSVRMQSTIAHALDEIRRVHGAGAAAAGGLPVDAGYVRPDGTIRLEQVPHDDEATFQNIRSAHTLGMFQIESPGQRELVGKMQPTVYNDLVADIALFRPGPMKGNMVSPFVGRKLGFETVEYLHPRFASITRDSYGVMIYHEHLLRIIADVMDVDLGEADEIRRAMTPENLPTIERRFRTSARRRSESGRRLFTDAQIEAIWTDVAAFGAYGFCKAHAASFCQTTWETAWLKTHFPVEFMAGILQHDPGMYAKRLLLGEARRLGIPILPIDVNTSTTNYLVETTPDGYSGIRLALVGIRGMSGAETARLLAQAPFSSVEDLYSRAKPSRPTLLRLAAIGALDSIAAGAARGEIIAHVRQLTTKKRPRPAPQETALDVAPGAAIIAAGAANPSSIEQLAAELSILGLEVSGHAIDPFRPMLAELGITPASDLLTLPAHSEVLVAGVRVATQTPPMRSGGRVVFITVDDGTGLADATFFAEAQQATGPALFGTRMLIIAGKTRRTGERGISIEATRAWDLTVEFAGWRSARLPGPATVTAPR